MTSARLVNSGKSDAIELDGFKPLVDAHKGAFTPSTITAAVGIYRNAAFRRHPTVSNVITRLSSYNSTSGSGNHHPLANRMKATAARMTEWSEELLQTNFYFTEAFIAASWHIKRSHELITAVEFIANIAFNEIGDGVTNISSSLDQGIAQYFGTSVTTPKQPLDDLVTALASTGTLYNYNDMQTYGTAQGLITSLTENKLANSTGLNEALAKFNVDTDQIDDPSYADQIKGALSSVRDLSALKTVSQQFGVTGTNISSLQDFTDVKKLTNNSIPNFNKSLSQIGSKFSEMGAEFSSSILGAAVMLNNLSTPSIPNLDSYRSLRALMNDLADDIVDLIFGRVDDNNDDDDGNDNDRRSPFAGKLRGTGPANMLRLWDYFNILTSNPPIDRVHDLTNIYNLTESMLDDIDAEIERSRALFDAAGFSGTTFEKPMGNLEGVLAFALDLHRHGADELFKDPETLTGVEPPSKQLVGPSVYRFMGSTEVLTAIASPNKYGEAVLAAMAEGKNRLLLLPNGMTPYEYTPPAVPNPLEGLPTGDAAVKKYKDYQARRNR